MSDDTTGTAVAPSTNQATAEHHQRIPADTVSALSAYLRATAEQICAEQPNVPPPGQLNQLDSFSAIQLLLEAENGLGVKLLENLGDFDGATFDEISEFILEFVADRGELDPVTERLRSIDADG